MQKKECRYLFYNSNSKEEMEKMWIEFLTEIHTRKVKAFLDDNSKKETKEEYFL